MISLRIFALGALLLGIAACGATQLAAVDTEVSAVDLQACYQADAGCVLDGAASTDDTFCPGCFAVQIGSISADAATAATPGSVSLPFSIAGSSDAPMQLVYLAIIGSADSNATLSIDICGVSRDISPLQGPFRVELSISASESTQIVATPDCALTLSTENGSYEVASVVGRWH
jgi:hypothetical protein